MVFVSFSTFFPFLKTLSQYLCVSLWQCWWKGNARKPLLLWWCRAELLWKLWGIMNWNSQVLSFPLLVLTKSSSFFIYYVLQKIGSQSIMVSFFFFSFFLRKLKDLLSVLQLITCQCCLINTRNVPPPSYWPPNRERTKVIKQGMYSRFDVLKQPWVYMLYGFTQFFNYFFSMVLIFFQKT